MSKNIKEIGKELLGKSLNSFHRKTGLTQLEKNNEMQDGILDGISSQVDDTYIEKTEQSNVMHLEGSGDGVVVLDSIEGNTMVNIIKQNDYRIDNSAIYRQENSIRIKRNSSSSRHFAYLNINNMWKENTIYTMVYIVEKNTFTKQLELNNNTGAQFDPFLDNGFKNFIINGTGVFIDKLTTKPKSEWHSTPMLYCTLPDYDETNLDQYIDFKMIVLEGDYSDKEINYFEGLQSSFEEKVNEQGKYEIEILSNNKNLFDGKLSNKPQHGGATVEHIDKNNFRVKATNAQYASVCYELKVKPNETYKLKVKGTKIKAQGGVYVRIYDKDDSYKSEEVTSVSLIENSFEKELKFTTKELTSNKFYGVQFYCVGQTTNTDGEWLYENVQLEKGTNSTNYVPNKTNKIKLLINEPLRSTTLDKDRLCIVDGKLMIERKNKQIIINGEESYKQSNLGEVVNCAYFEILDIVDAKKRTQNGEVYCDRLPSLGEVNKYQDKENIFCDPNYNLIGIKISRSKLTTHDIDGIKTYFRNNNTKLCYPLKEPYYEEVLNEYGEPIILEGYENGTLYIDSTVIPTTTVRYTPKMESFKTLKEVNKNNNLITLDINENIIPYMMDVDYMIMEKELCLLNTKNIRKMEELDMTSMQKRTQDMLERLIKGKTLTEQECKTRVTTYLNAGKITDEQAEELMLVISEVYA